MPPVAQISVGNVLSGVSVVAMALFGYVLTDIREDLREVRTEMSKVRETQQTVLLSTVRVQDQKIVTLTAEVSDAHERIAKMWEVVNSVQAAQRRGK